MMARLLALRRVDARGGLINLSSLEADQSWQRLAAKYPSDFLRSEKAEAARHAAQIRGEHTRAAAEAESAGRIPDAIAAVTRLIELDDDDAGLYLRRANLCARLQKWDDADADFDRAEKLGSTVAVWAARGWTFLTRGQPERAIAEADRALEAGADRNGDLQAQHLRGHSLAAMDRFAEASQVFSRLVQRAPLTVSYWESLATIEQCTGDLAAWRATCAGAFQRLADNANDYTTERLVVLCTLGPDCGVDAQALVKLAEQLLSRQPANPQCQRAFAAALYRAGDFDRALDRWLELAGPQQNTGDATAMLYLAMCYHRLDEADEARVWFDKADKWVTAMQRPTKAKQQKWAWNYRLPLESLHREAKALLAGREM